MRDMFEGRAGIEPLDEDRHPGVEPTSIRQWLSVR
jgi:hypothetical protein